MSRRKRPEVSWWRALFCSCYDPIEPSDADKLTYPLYTRALHLGLGAAFYTIFSNLVLTIAESSDANGRISGGLVPLLFSLPLPLLAGGGTTGRHAMALSAANALIICLLGLQLLVDVVSGFDGHFREVASGVVVIYLLRTVVSTFLLWQSLLANRRLLDQGLEFFYEAAMSAILRARRSRKNLSPGSPEGPPSAAGKDVQGLFAKRPSPGAAAPGGASASVTPAPTQGWDANQAWDPSAQQQHGWHSTHQHQSWDQEGQYAEAGY